MKEISELFWWPDGVIVVCSCTAKIHVRCSYPIVSILIAPCKKSEEKGVGLITVPCGPGEKEELHNGGFLGGTFRGR